MKDIIKRIYDYSLEEIMGLRFGSYSKEIIQNRAIPDVRDGLKPVQRRILYGMLKDNNTYNKPHRKSANAVGYIMGHFHPHGDSSIYDAMVRLSQWWKQNHPLVDMDGNNGSMDGDPAAAYRYTEARLSKISDELLRDINKNTVSFAPTYDDKELEPTVLPSRFPNILVNGTTGISAGYATNIPPHNLNEVCDAAILLLKDPETSLNKILEVVKGPDFPTGAIVLGQDGIVQALETGRGRVFVRSKVEVYEDKKENHLIVTEIPFEVNKQLLVKKIAELAIDKTIDGLIEIRDESDREGMRIVIDIKKDINYEVILNYLYKNTDLQITYNYNMIVIDQARPKQLGIIPILKSYIAHQQEVVTRRINYDLAHAKSQYHIIEGLIKAISILDEVIAVIRASKNKANAKENLVIKFGFTEVQAEAIVTLQLYRLTNTDVTLLLEELKNLKALIEGYESVLGDNKLLDKLIIEDLKKIKKEYGYERKSKIVEVYEDIKVDTTSLISKEDVVVVVTKDGYIKRINNRSFSSSSEEMPLKENDYLVGYYKVNTLDTILIFTDLGNYIYLPVHLIPELKFREMPKHLNSVIQINSGEKIIGSYPVTNFEDNIMGIVATKKGFIKRIKLSDFKVARYSKPINMMNLKDNDEVVSVVFSNKTNVLVTCDTGYGLWYDVRQIPLTSLKASGVKSMALKNEVVTNVSLFSENDNYITLVTNKGGAKRLKISDLEQSNRAKRGLILFKEIKSNPSKIINHFILDIKEELGIITTNEMFNIKISDIKIMDRYASLSSISKHNIISCYKKVSLIEAINLNKEDVVTYEELTNLEAENYNSKELTLF